MCYIPLLAFVFLFTEQNKSDEFKANIKYAIWIFIVYAIIQTVFGLFLGSILFLVYVLISIFLGYKAYNGKKIKIDQIDEFETKIKENMK